MEKFEKDLIILAVNNKIVKLKQHLRNCLKKERLDAAENYRNQIGKFIALKEKLSCSI